MKAVESVRKPESQSPSRTQPQSQEPTRSAGRAAAEGPAPRAEPVRPAPAEDRAEVSQEGDTDEAVPNLSWLGGGVEDVHGEAAGDAPPPEDRQTPSGSTNEERRDSIGEALNEDGAVQFTNSRGDEVEVEVQQQGDNTYEVMVDGHPVEVEIGDDYDSEQVLADFVDYYSELPPEAREALERVVVENGEFDNENFDGYVEGDDAGTIHLDAGAFSNGRLSRDLFHHEFGHVLGADLEDQDDGGFENFRESIFGEGGNLTPDDFDDAYEADGEPDLPGNSAGDSEHTEEFADGWQTYLDARLAGGEELEEFREQYPELAELYEEIYTGSYA